MEPVFGHLKNVFGMRRTHLRGKKKVETDVGIAFMMMNLSKYWNRRWSKDQSSLRKNKNNKKKTVKQLKLRVGLIVFWYLKVIFFPDTLLCLLVEIIDCISKLVKNELFWYFSYFCFKERNKIQV